MSVNKVILIGRLGKDPEVRYMTSGEAVANFSLATSERWKDKSGEQQEKTEWHNCVAYRKLGEIIGEYCHKGDNLYVEGKLSTRKWEDKEGVTRYMTEVIINSIDFLTPKGDRESRQPATGSAPSTGTKPATRPQTTGGGFDNFDDDIPFAPIGMNGAGVGWRAI